MVNANIEYLNSVQNNFHLFLTKRLKKGTLSIRVPSQLWFHIIRIEAI